MWRLLMVVKKIHANEYGQFAPSNCSLKIMKPTIRIASIEEVDLVSDILCEAAKWLTEKGEPLWKAGELAAEKLSVDVSNGMFYIAWVGNDAAGVFKFQSEDKLFWPDVPDGESCFIHRVAVRRDHAGKGISSAMIDYAKAATEVLGRRFLRLDTDATRPKLRAVYEQQGFMFHSTRQVGPYFVARYEIEVGTAN